MKKAYNYILLILILIFNSCGEPVKLVLGEWTWVESTGGLLPARTPENTGTTGRLELTRDRWKYFEDGQLIEDFAVKIKRRSKGLILETGRPEGDKIIEFITDDEITITYYGGPNSDCQDCSVNRFVRITTN